MAPVGPRKPDEQIIGTIKEKKAGMARAEICRRNGLISATSYKLKASYGGMDLSDAQRLRALKGEIGQAETDAG